MRLGKKLFSCFSLLALGIMCFFAAVPKAQAAEFLTPANETFIYMNTLEKDIDYDNKALKFARSDTNVLQLTSQDGKQVYLSFCASEKDGVGFTVREIRTTNPAKTFYEINADAGAHGQNCGYWLVGKHHGQWVQYVSLESFVPLGYSLSEWHRLAASINKNGDGRFILNDTQMQLELFWDDDAQWFGVQCLQKYY